jgi:hypothetical protein
MNTSGMMRKQPQRKQLTPVRGYFNYSETFLRLSYIYFALTFTDFIFCSLQSQTKSTNQSLNLTPCDSPVSKNISCSSTFPELNNLSSFNSFSDTLHSIHSYRHNSHLNLILKTIYHERISLIAEIQR